MNGIFTAPVAEDTSFGSIQKAPLLPRLNLSRALAAAPSSVTLVATHNVAVRTKGHGPLIWQRGKLRESALVCAFAALAIETRPAQPLAEAEYTLTPILLGCPATLSARSRPPAASFPGALARLTALRIIFSRTFNDGGCPIADF
jgi:hypothetical protein